MKTLVPRLLPAASALTPLTAAVISLAALISLVATPAAAQDRAELTARDAFELSFTTGADTSLGDYGAFQETNILVVPFSLRAKQGPFRLSATIPYLRIDGPASIVAAGGGESDPVILNPFLPVPREVRKGFGDLNLGVTWSLPSDLPGGLEVDLTARVKLPTSSRRKALGTGKTDFSVMAEASRPFGIVTPFVAVGYRMPGDPDGFDLKNIPTASFGASVPLGNLVAIASYDYSGATSRFSRDSHSVFAALSGPIGDRLSLTTYGTVGISEGAPDYGLGVLVSFRIF